MIQNTGETLGDLVHADGNNGALLGYELAGKPYVAVDEVEGISEFLVQGCDKEELFASGCMKAAQGLHGKAIPHGLIVQENGHGTCSIALHGSQCSVQLVQFLSTSFSQSRPKSGSESVREKTFALRVRLMRTEVSSKGGLHERH